MSHLKYLARYSKETQEHVRRLINQQKLEHYLLHKYPKPHTIKTDKALFNYVTTLKNSYMRKSAPLSKTLFDGKIHVIDNALGTHRFISRVQGAKLKAKNEIRVASIFKSVPEAFLEMIVVHELAHFKEKEHNKAFYQLCEHMQAAYHQHEFDLRLYLTLIDNEGKIEQWQ